MTLKRLRYVSRFAQPLSPKDIDALTKQSAENNAALDITGILMTTGELFFQLLEGPSDPLERLYKKIVFDPRHTDVLLLRVEEDIEERFFPDWSMKKVEVDEASNLRLEPVREMLSSIIEQRVRIEKLTNALERTIWREMMDVLSD